MMYSYVCPLCGGYFLAPHHLDKSARYCPWCKSPVITPRTTDDVVTVQVYVAARDKYLAMLAEIEGAP